MAVKELVKAKQQTQLEESSQIVLDFSGIIDFTDNQLFEFCAKNRELQIERTKEEKLIVMAPVGGEGSEREFLLSGIFYLWNKKYKLGKIFSPSGGFILNDKAMRSADVSFISNEKWKSLSKEQRKKFPPLCPDFVVELRSESDRLKDLKEKMEEWMANGCRLAWLIDPYEEKSYIYRPNKKIELIDSFDKKLSGEDVLPKFQLDLSELREEEE